MDPSPQSLRMDSIECPNSGIVVTPDSQKAYFVSRRLDPLNRHDDHGCQRCVYFSWVKSVFMFGGSSLAVSSLALRCSHDWKVDGADRICMGGLFKNKLWGYVWPPEHIRKVDFYLDGKFRRSEEYPPFELDGGAATGLGNGPHELRAVLQFKDGSKPMTLTSTFDVGKPPLRCSADAVIDGNDQACDARTFYTWLRIYWWPNTGVKSVDFYLDGKFRRTERSTTLRI